MVTLYRIQSRFEMFWDVDLTSTSSSQQTSCQMGSMWWNFVVLPKCSASTMWNWNMSRWFTEVLCVSCVCSLFETPQEAAPVNRIQPGKAVIQCSWPFMVESATEKSGGNVAHHSTVMGLKVVKTSYVWRKNHDCNCNRLESSKNHSCIGSSKNV